MIDVILLGTGGMLPLPDRWLSSLLMRSRGELTLFDCGEGTQIAMREAGWGFRRLGSICVSHTHADHIAGLPGLLHTVANAGRTEPFAIYGPVGMADIVRGLRTIAPILPYEVQVRELASGDQFPLPGGLEGSYLAGEHALPVLAYRVDLPRGRAFLPERARALGVPQVLWRRLQSGEGVIWDDRSATTDDVLGPPRRGLALGYVTDTRPLPTFAPFLAGVDLLVCEGTYGDDADAAKAARNLHMTFREAAEIARDAEVDRLWLTHFSPALEHPDEYAANATEVFPSTTVGYDGLTTSLRFRDD
jgi:ribonuclease Z